MFQYCSFLLLVGQFFHPWTLFDSLFTIDKTYLNVDNMHKEARRHILERRLLVLNSLIKKPSSVSGWRLDTHLKTPELWGQDRQRCRCAVNVPVNRPGACLTDKHEMTRVSSMDGDSWLRLTAQALTTPEATGRTPPMPARRPAPRSDPKTSFIMQQRQSKGWRWGVQTWPSGEKRISEMMSSFFRINLVWLCSTTRERGL